LFDWRTLELPVRRPRYDSWPYKKHRGEHGTKIVDGYCLPWVDIESKRYNESYYVRRIQPTLNLCLRALCVRDPA
jgi:hypothetical protein